MKLNKHTQIHTRELFKKKSLVKENHLKTFLKKHTHTRIGKSIYYIDYLLNKNLYEEKFKIKWQKKYEKNELQLIIVVLFLMDYIALE